MLDAGIRDPRLAITELQLFAFVKGQGGDAYPTPPRIPTPATISEALYLMLLVHEAARLGNFVEMITHTGTVNHGGGLRKAHERVWANPVHYAHVLGRDLAGSHPVAVRLSCGTFSTRQTFGHLPLVDAAPDLDALAVLSPDAGLLTLSLVHRSADSGPIDLSIDLGSFPAAGDAAVLILAGDSLADQNTPEEPERITPHASRLAVSAGRLRLTLPPFSLMRIQIRRA
jgi:alpha-N-arabinofuranosidase